MSGKPFLDSNVVLYLYSEDEPEKQAAAQRVASGAEPAWVSTQVLSEMANVLRRKFKLSYPDISAAIREIQATCRVHTITANTVLLALTLAERYRHSYFDSLIVAAALECGCDTLVSEDMQDGLVVESRLVIQNPFR